MPSDEPALTWQGSPIAWRLENIRTRRRNRTALKPRVLRPDVFGRPPNVCAASSVLNRRLNLLDEQREYSS